MSTLTEAADDFLAELARVTAELARVTAERDEWVLKSADAVTDFVEKSLNKAVARAEKAEKARDELMQQMSATNDDIKQFLGTHAATKERLEKAEKANAAWRVLAERARECLVSTSHHEECGRSDECEDADPGDCGEHGSGGCPACDCGASEWHETAAELHAALKETT